MTKNPVTFWEIACHDCDRTADFLKKVFDWDIKKAERFPNFYDVNSAGETGINGGVFTLRKAKLPFLTIYIKVENIEEKARLVEENGGFITVPVEEISSGTKICLFNEPMGVQLAMYENILKK